MKILVAAAVCAGLSRMPAPNVVRRTVPSTQKSIHTSSYLSRGESHFSANPVRNLAMQHRLDNLARLKKIAMSNVYDNAVERLIENFYGDENPEIHTASLEILGAAVTAGNKRAIPAARQAALEGLDGSSNYYGRSGITRKAAIDVVRVLAHQGYLCQHLIRSLVLRCWDEESAVRVHALEAFIFMLNVIKRTDFFYGRLHEEAERVCSQILIAMPDDIECVRKGFELLIRLEEKELCDDAILNVILSLYEREKDPALAQAVQYLSRIYAQRLLKIGSDGW